MSAGRLSVVWFAIVAAGCDSAPTVSPGRVGCVEFDVPPGYAAVSFVDGLAHGWKLSQTDGGSPDDEVRVWGMATTVENVDDWQPGTVQRYFDEADAGVARKPLVVHLTLDGVPALKLSSVGLRDEDGGTIEVHRTLLLVVHDHVGVMVAPIYETPAGVRDVKALVADALIASVRTRQCTTSPLKRWWRRR